MMLIPTVVEMPADAVALVLGEAEILSGLGLGVEAFGPSAARAGRRASKAVRSSPTTAGTVAPVTESVQTSATSPVTSAGSSARASAARDASASSAVAVTAASMPS